MSSLTTQVFGVPGPRRYRVYYIIDNSEKLDIALAQSYPVVLMFHANWNVPCTVMLKPFRDMALAKRNQAIFCRLDVDKFKTQDIVERYQVEALPTFVLIKNREVKGRVVGAKVDELNTTIKDNI